MPDATGIKAIADALRVNASLTELNLAGNQLRSEGAKALAPAIAASASLTALDLHHNYIGQGGPEGIKAIADALRVSASLTQAFFAACPPPLKMALMAAACACTAEYFLQQPG